MRRKAANGHRRRRIKPRTCPKHSQMVRRGSGVRRRRAESKVAARWENPDPPDLASLRLSCFGVRTRDSKNSLRRSRSPGLPEGSPGVKSRVLRPDGPPAVRDSRPDGPPAVRDLRPGGPPAERDSRPGGPPAARDLRPDGPPARVRSFARSSQRRSLRRSPRRSPARPAVAGRPGVRSPARPAGASRPGVRSPARPAGAGRPGVPAQPAAAGRPGRVRSFVRSRVA